MLQEFFLPLEKNYAGIRVKSITCLALSETARRAFSRSAAAGASSSMLSLISALMEAFSFALAPLWRFSKNRCSRFACTSFTCDKFTVRQPATKYGIWYIYIYTFINLLSSTVVTWVTLSSLFFWYFTPWFYMGRNGTGQDGTGRDERALAKIIILGNIVFLPCVASSNSELHMPSPTLPAPSSR